MKAKKSLMGLPRPKDLRSNKLEDIQDYMKKFTDELDRQYRLLFQDIATIQVDDNGYIYFGGKDTDNSWRIGRDGLDWVLQHNTAGTWTTVDTAKGS